MNPTMGKIQPKLNRAIIRESGNGNCYGRAGVVLCLEPPGKRDSVRWRSGGFAFVPLKAFLENGAPYNFPFENAFKEI